MHRNLTNNKSLYSIFGGAKLINCAGGQKTYLYNKIFL